MILRELRLRSFRAHQETELAFAPKVNLLYGPNGAGKTNILEAIHYLCLSKSFLSGRDRYALQKGAPFFEVEGLFDSERRGETRVRLAYVPGEGKKLFVNGAPLERMAEIVGMLPIVIFSPDDYVLTAEGPDERRKFINNILSQARPVYLDDLMKYRRARRQRNELLRQYKGRSAPPDELIAPWTEELVQIGTRIVRSRAAFVDTFREYLQRAYEQIETVAERPRIEYNTIGEVSAQSTSEEVAAIFHDALERTVRGERKRGTTLVGPQRDELDLYLGDLPVRRYGSQGQHRTMGMALKLAQFFYLQDRTEMMPLLLLDDAFGKLDPGRASAFLQLLRSEAIGQSLITDTRRSSFEDDVDFSGEAHRAIQITAGEVEAVTEE